MDKKPTTANKNQVPDLKVTSPLEYSPLSPSHELIVWEKWIQIRKEEVIKLAEKVKRPPIDLAMNQTRREEIEIKTVLEHAQIERQPKMRGHVHGFISKLKSRYECEPVYEVHRTPAELGRPPKIQHIGVPTHIQETELGIIGDSQCIKHNFTEYTKYRKKREFELKEKIRKIDPFRCSTKDLIIQGHRPKPPPPPPPKPPNITVEIVKLAEITTSDIYAVKINKTVLYVHRHGMEHLAAMRKLPWHEDCTSWTYYFNVPRKRVGRGKLFLQNIGTVTLRYCWRIIKKSVLFIQTDVTNQVFFFNKNENILAPGQSREICFTFISDKRGIYNEYWELIFDKISFFDNVSQKLTIHLHADSIENTEGTKQKVETFKKKILEKSISNLADDLLSEILDTIFALTPQTYPYKKYFLEAQLFVLKNPECYYHQTEVLKLNNLYQEMNNGTSWDLSIASWRKSMMAQNCEHRFTYYDELKKSYSELLRPWTEGDTLIKEKHRAVRNLLGDLADKFDKGYQRLVDIYIAPSSSAPTESTQNIQENDALMLQNIQNLFYLHAYDYVATTMEECAGVLSSLDLQKWIDFDFCRI